MDVISPWFRVSSPQGIANKFEESTRIYVIEKEPHYKDKNLQTYETDARPSLMKRFSKKNWLNGRINLIVQRVRALPKTFENEPRIIL